MKKNKLCVSANSYATMKQAVDELRERNFEIKKISYITERNRYDISLTATLAETYELLDLTKKFGVILWKGEP